MRRSLYIYMVMICGLLSAMISCKEDEEIKSYSSFIDPTNSYLADRDRLTTVLLFSTDGGETYEAQPNIAVGQKYLVKINNTRTQEDVTEEDSYAFDWSTSNPKPNSGVNEAIAEFTMQESNNVVVKVSEGNCPMDMASWEGTYDAVEYYTAGSTDPYDLTLTQDATIPNRFHLDNFYGSHLEAYIEIADDGTVNFPEQEVDGLDITRSSGQVYPCKDRMTIRLNYDGEDWVYRIERQ